MAIVDGKFIPELFTSKDILDLWEVCPSGLESITEKCRFKYQLTEGEADWLRWIGDRYSIADYLWDNWEANEEDDDAPGVVLIEVMEIGRVLAEEGLDRAPCLCEDTALAKLIWFIGPDEDYDPEDYEDENDG